jgi:hypothetical protein
VWTRLGLDQLTSLIGDINGWKPHPRASRRQLPVRLWVALKSDSYATAAAVLRTANDSINRETPLMIILTPTNVPIAQAELDGHCM